jgi:ATP-dependent Clp protease protease subunit
LTVKTGDGSMQKDSSKTSSDSQTTPSPEDSGIYLFMDAVNETSCKDLISFIFTKNLGNPKPKYLQIVINSGGGDLNAAFAVIDVIKGSIVPVYTIGIGCVASAAFAIFITGEKGHRTLTPNTSIMSHQYTWGTYGKEHELFASVKEYELTTKRMIAHYKRCTGLTEKKVREYLLPAQDVWLSATEAKKLGICDKIKDLK